MNNFVYFNPTRIVFGKGTIAQLAGLVPADRKVLITYGGGSIKANGVYDQVTQALAGRRVLEFGGIQPNPQYETLMQAAALAKRESVDLLLAVGGGSVLDGTKFIAAAVRFEGADPWDLCRLRATVTCQAALPMGAVLTLPATGSESNGFSVVSRQSTREKLAFGSEHTYPRFSILDPAVTMSLPVKQVRNGIVDAFAHVMEQYATQAASTPVQDRQAEGVLLTLIEEGPRTLKDPTNYDARANFMWAATQALNGLLGVGIVQDWGTHMIGHELTAFYGLAHAETLAIVMPALMRHQMPIKRAKLAQLARRVFGVNVGDGDLAEAGVAGMERFFHSLGMPTRLAEYQISPADAAAKVFDRFTRRESKVGEGGRLGAAEARQILLAC